MKRGRKLEEVRYYLLHLVLKEETLKPRGIILFVIKLSGLLFRGRALRFPNQRTLAPKLMGMKQMSADEMDDLHTSLFFSYKRLSLDFCQKLGTN